MRVEHYRNIANKMEERFKDVPRVLHGDCYCNSCREALQAIKADRHVKAYRNIGNPHVEGLSFSEEGQ